LSIKKHYPAINYTSRDFNSIKSDLVQYAKRYYPSTYKDFNEAGFGSLMLDTVSYIGDMLSFYVDYNANESFLDTAIEFNNVLKLGRQLGYNFRGNPSSFGIVDFFVIVPGTTAGLGVDTTYIPTLRKGTLLSSQGGVGFILNEDVNFANPDNHVVIAREDANTGLATHYAIKASGQVLSGEIRSERIVVGDFEKFLRIELQGQNITEILSVTDSEGNNYFRVDYLSQDVVYSAVKNYDTNRANVPSTLKPFIVPRRYIAEQLEDTVFLQFGAGNSTDTTSDPLTDPSRTIVNYHGREFISSLSFDPTNLIGTPSLGIAPANTEITVVYRANTTPEVNVAAQSLTTIVDPIVDFTDITLITPAKASDVIASLEVSNASPINGDVSSPSVRELKTRISDSFASQRRAVTERDYQSMIYAMPPEFGAVKRANIIRDPDSFKRNLNVYVVSESDSNTLEETNSTVKQNLKTWLNQGRMINDTVDIIDAKIVNIGIDFVIVGDLESNKFEILNRAISVLANYYDRKMEIGESFSITDIYSLLNRVPGVVDTVSVRVKQKFGNAYSLTRFNLERATSPDGRFISVPDNVVMEVKFPAQDIRGNIK